MPQQFTTPSGEPFTIKRFSGAPGRFFAELPHLRTVFGETIEEVYEKTCNEDRIWSVLRVIVPSLQLLDKPVEKVRDPVTGQVRYRLTAEGAAEAIRIYQCVAEGAAEKPDVINPTACQQALHRLVMNTGAAFSTFD